MGRVTASWVVLIVLWTGIPGPRAQNFTRISTGTPVVTDVSVNYTGAAWIDYDGDGDLDLFVANGFLYRNDGASGFTRVVTAIGSGITAATGNGTTWGDYDNDGNLDAFVCSGQSKLYRNLGNGSFSAVTFGAIGQAFGNRGWSCAWADIDLDGDLDLAITHPAGFVPGGATTNHLLVNLGPPAYSFLKVTSTPITSNFTSFTVGSWSDFDLDGDMDYFIGAGPANGTLQADFLYRNNIAGGGNGIERITEAPIATDLQDGQLWNWIDYDNDGDLDGYLTNWRGTANGMVNRLYRNDGTGYARVSTGAIVTDAHSSLSSVWGDFDNDGDLDCFVANDSGQSNKFYRNNGNGTFSSVINATTESITHRGASAGDYDGDGDLDLYADGPSGGRRLYRNDTSNGNHWLKLNLVGVESNRSAIGAQVRARATIGGQSVGQLREVLAQNTFNGHNALQVHFGFGDAESVESLSIRWPSSGIGQTLTDVAIDQTLEIVENTVTPAIPDGAGVPGEMLRASREGDQVTVTWDAKSCPATAVNVYQGALGAHGSFIAGDCDLPASGTATLDIPGNRWFLVVATDGAMADGAYGAGAGGAEREIHGAATVCPQVTQHVVATECF